MAAIASILGVLSGLPSTLAAILVRARVAFLDIVVVFISGTVPMSRLKTRVDFLASLTVSLKLASSGLSELSLGAADATDDWLTFGITELSRGGTILGRLGTAPRLTMVF